ncbi:unnamed protein product [Mytilus edulis]|uniref:Myb-like domain-containing protein n=1 Tax=Mytilus edulis TaxID=6550 RepID=A0A8S3RAV9_MYTED|nr:unnamed protein product [Mytilus edulis]
MSSDSNRHCCMCNTCNGKFVNIRDCKNAHQHFSSCQNFSDVDHLYNLQKSHKNDFYQTPLFDGSSRTIFDETAEHLLFFFNLKWHVKSSSYRELTACETYPSYKEALSIIKPLLMLTIQYKCCINDCKCFPINDNVRNCSVCNELLHYKDSNRYVDQSADQFRSDVEIKAPKTSLWSKLATNTLIELHFASSQCEQKWKNITKAYKDTVDHNRKSGNGKKKETEKQEGVSKEEEKNKAESRSVTSSPNPGFFICLFHCFLNKQVRQGYAHYQRRRKASQLLESKSFSSSDFPTRRTRDNTEYTTENRQWSDEDEILKGRNHHANTFYTQSKFYNPTFAH